MTTNHGVKITPKPVSVEMCGRKRTAEKAANYATVSSVKKLFLSCTEPSGTAVVPQWYGDSRTERDSEVTWIQNHAPPMCQT